MSGYGKNVSVLFVCLGNICRSPTAHGVFAHKIAAAGLEAVVHVDSCGTSQWHIGEAPDARSAQEAALRGYDLSSLRARQVEASDFHDFDYILAMDDSNLDDLRGSSPAAFTGHLGLFLDFAADVDEREVPDPYYGGDAGFGRVLDMIEQASDGLIAEFVQQGLARENS